MQPAMLEVRNAMVAAVEDAYAEKRTDPTLIRAQMNAARESTLRALFGRVIT